MKREGRIEYVRKRDGSIVPFNKQKIADAIFKAAQSVGGQDRYLAEDLAEVVKIYLEKEYKGDIPSVEEIQDIVERVLIKTGHAKTAKAYILYRQRRARARQIREGIRPEDLAEREVMKKSLARDISISVRRSDDKIGIWDKNIIVEALVRETGISRNIAEIIVSEVEEDVIASKVKNLTSSMIRELVNAKLIQYGFEEERLKHSRIGLPFYDIYSILNSFKGSPDELSFYLGRRMKREFAMNSVIPQSLVERYLKGEIIIKNIEGIDKFLDAYIPLKTIDEIPTIYKKISPVVEGSVVFSLLDKSVPSPSIDGFCMELPYSIIKNAGVKDPSVIRIEGMDELNEFFKKSHQGKYTISLHRKTDVSLFIVNRIILNLPAIHISAENDGVPFERRLKEILDGINEMLISQEKLIRTIPYTGEILSEREYIITMEIALESGREEEIPEGILSEIFSRSLSLYIKTSEISLAGLSYCIEKQGLTVRIHNG